MPIVHLVVHVHNSRGDALTNATVSVDFSGAGTGQPAAASRPDPKFATFEVLFPTEPPKIRLLVDHPSGFSVEQEMSVTYGKTPALSIDPAKRDVQIHHFGQHSRDGQTGWNLEVFVTMTSVRDAKQTIQNETGRAAPFQDSRTVMKVPTPILAAAPAFFGSSLAEATVDPPGELFWLERREVPRLVAMWVPKPILDEVKKWPGAGDARALPVHLFFHPNIPADKAWRGSYPFSTVYIDLVARYMLLPFVLPVPPNIFQPNKALVHQATVSGKSTIVVLPVGSQREQFGTAFLKQSSVHLLLHDLVYFLQRRLGVPMPVVINPVAQLTVSAFSAGIRFLAQVLEGREAKKGGDDTFFNRVLKEVYVFDGVFSGPSGAAELGTFTDALRAWFRGGSEGRVLRVYTQHDEWLTKLAAQIGAVTVSGRDGAREHSGAASASAALMTREFFHQFVLSKNSNWDVIVEGAARQALKLPENKGKTLDDMKKHILYNFAHQLIPGWFLEHALSVSKIS